MPPKVPGEDGKDLSGGGDCGNRRERTDWRHLAKEEPLALRTDVAGVKQARD